MAEIRIICAYPDRKESEVELFADSPILIKGDYIQFGVDGTMRIIPTNKVIRIELV